MMNVGECRDSKENELLIIEQCVTRYISTNWAFIMYIRYGNILQNIPKKAVCSPWQSESDDIQHLMTKYNKTDPCIMPGRQIISYKLSAAEFTCTVNNVHKSINKPTTSHMFVNTLWRINAIQWSLKKCSTFTLCVIKSGFINLDHFKGEWDSWSHLVGIVWLNCYVRWSDWAHASVFCFDSVDKHE